MQSTEQSGNNQAGTPQGNDQAEQPGISNLDELLAAGEQEATEETESEQPGGTESAESSGDAEKAKPTKFNDLAGATDMELDALYKLEINLDDDSEPVTIEQLKDSYKQRSEFEKDRFDFEETRTQQETELLRARQELNDILEALPKNAVRPEVLERIRAKNDQRMKVERARTLDAIPAWNNQDKRTADLAAMSEHLAQYGFPTEHLGTLQDHRWFPYIRDNMAREKRVREALAKVKAGKPEKAATPKPQKTPPKKGGNLGTKKLNTGPDRLAAVFSNID